jgi:hypothetical protein
MLEPDRTEDMGRHVAGIVILRESKDLARPWHLQAAAKIFPLAFIRDQPSAPSAIRNLASPTLSRHSSSGIDSLPFMESSTWP